MVKKYVSFIHFLRDAEEEFIGYCDTPCSRAWYVDIGTVVNGNPCRIWTRKFGSDGDKSNKVLDHKLPLYSPQSSPFPHQSAKSLYCDKLLF